LTVGPLEAHLSFAIVIAVLAVIATGIGARFLPREGSQHRTAQLLRAR
jgi:multisubunit Na+/H+ antiporter MnhF subunit